MLTTRILSKYSLEIAPERCWLILFKGLRARLEVTHPKGIDYLINNAGISGKIVSDKDDLLATFTTHVLGPWMLIHELLPLVQRSTKKVIVGISSLAGCLTYQKSSDEFYGTHFKGDFAGYRISKTAQNCCKTPLPPMLLTFI